MQTTNSKKYNLCLKGINQTDYKVKNDPQTFRNISKVKHILMCQNFNLKHCEFKLNRDNSSTIEETIPISPHPYKLTQH